MSQGGVMFMARDAQNEEEPIIMRKCVEAKDNRLPGTTIDAKLLMICTRTMKM